MRNLRQSLISKTMDFKEIAVFRLYESQQSLVLPASTGMALEMFSEFNESRNH